MRASELDAAIRELEREVKRLQEAIATLRKIQTQRGGKADRKVRRLSAQGRRRISEAAKKRWAAYRNRSRGRK